MNALAVGSMRRRQPLKAAGWKNLSLTLMSTSPRVPTFAKIKLVTENFPEESHWTWKRWNATIGAFGVNYHPDEPHRMTVMIPKGDSPHIARGSRRVGTGAEESAGSSCTLT